jgi:tRNA-dihydrouridine synthase
MNQTIPTPDSTFSIAPMLDWTDKHYRYFARITITWPSIGNNMAIHDYWWQ